MPVKGICAALFLMVPLLGQTSGGPRERIQNAPLTPDERLAVSASFSQRDCGRLEAILAGAPPSGVSMDHAGERLALLGALEFLSGRMIQAVQAFQRADAQKTLDDHDRFTLAMALVELGDFKASRSELTRLNELHPNASIYLYWLGRLDYDQRLYNDAVDKFKKVTSMDPMSVRAFDNLGLTYDMMGLTDEAQAAFARAVTLNRGLATPSPWPPHNLGYLQLRLQQFGQAEANLREALKYEPKFALAHYHLGRVLEKGGRSELAIQEYKTAAALNAKLAEPLYSLVLLYRRRGQDAEAAGALAEYHRRKALSADSQ